MGTFSIAKPSMALAVLVLIGSSGSGMLKLLLFVFFVPFFDDWMIILVNLHLFSPFSPFLLALPSSQLEVGMTAGMLRERIKR